MSTYNGEPYPGFFRRENETDEQYRARQPISIRYKGKIVDPELAKFDADLIGTEHGLPADSVIVWDGDQNTVRAHWIEPHTGDIAELRAEVAELKDTLKRTEDFVNSMLRNKTVETNTPMNEREIDLQVIKTPINIPAKRAINRTADYDRAMSMVKE